MLPVMVVLPAVGEVAGIAVAITVGCVTWVGVASPLPPHEESTMLTITRKVTASQLRLRICISHAPYFW
jgi:hypothetical protein